MSLPESRTVPDERDLRWFGVIIAVFFGLLGSVAFWGVGAASVASRLWATGLGLAGLYYAVPPLQLPLYRGWMAAVWPIGWTVTHGVLALVFYGLITPMAFVMRIFGRDRMGRRLDRSVVSYWTAHDPGGDTRRYFRQT